jgi:hypothetical protein
MRRLGSCLGIAALIASSALLSLAGLFVPTPFMGLLAWFRRESAFRDSSAAGCLKRSLICSVSRDANDGWDVHDFRRVFSDDRGVGSPRTLVRTSSCLGAAVQSWGHRIVAWALILLGASIVYGIQHRHQPRRLFVKGSSMSARTTLGPHRFVRGYPPE